MDPSQLPNDNVIEDGNTNPTIGINITPCEDLRSSTSDNNSEHSQSPSKFKLPISITDLWRIRRKEKLKKRFLAKSLRLGNDDDGDEDSDSYSFDHDSLATPSINTSQIDPSLDSDKDISWSSDNSPGGSRSSSLDSESPEESWGSPPYGNIQRDSHGSSEDPLSQGDSSRRGSVCTIIDSHSRKPKSFLISNQRETGSNIDTADKQLKTKGSELASTSEASSESSSKISECTIDENEEFKQIMKNMTIASFSNKKINAYESSDESSEETEEQVRKLSNIADPIDLLSGNSIFSEILNAENIDKVEGKDYLTNALPNVVSQKYCDKLKSFEGESGYEDNEIDNECKNISTKENTNIRLNTRERDENGINSNTKGVHKTENNIQNNLNSSSHEKRNITQSLEFRKIEKSVGLGIDKSCFWCCEIL